MLYLGFQLVCSLSIQPSQLFTAVEAEAACVCVSAVISSVLQPSIRLRPPSSTLGFISVPAPGDNPADN